MESAHTSKPIRHFLSDGALQHAGFAVVSHSTVIEGVESRKFVPLFNPAVIAVAVWLAQGAAQYLGGLAMSKILGHPSLSDLADLIQRSFSELKEFIREELRRQLSEQDFLEMRASLKSTVDNLRDYGVLPPESQKNYAYMVESAYLEAGKVMGRAAEYGLSAVSLYASACSLRLLAIIAQKSYRPMGELGLLVNENVKAGRTHVERVVRQHEISWDPELRVSQVTVGAASIWDGTYQPVPVSYWCSLDNVYFEHWIRPDGAAAFSGDPNSLRAQEFRRELVRKAAEDSAARVAQVAAPINEVVRQWEELEHA